jgi:hypothetical protein
MLPKHIADCPSPAGQAVSLDEGAGVPSTKGVLS